jgi:putative ABC transport system substrate-binding protein
LTVPAAVEPGRRTVLYSGLCLLGAALIPPPADCQPRQTTARLGVVSGGPRGTVTNSPTNTAAERLRELGWIEGQNLVIEYRHTDRRYDLRLFREAVRDVVSRDVDVILATQPYAVVAAHEVTRTLPIVAVDLEHDPVERGLVASVARPGGNLTGVFLDQPELAGKQVQILREAVPGLARLAVLWDGNVSGPQFRAITNATRLLGGTVESFEVRSRDGVDPALAAIARTRIQALVVVSSPLVWSIRARVAEFTVEQRLPAICLFDDFTDHGGLLSYGPSWRDIYRRAADLIDRILRGAKPSALPLDRPSRFQMAINLRTARAIDLTLPPALLFRADRVIQ